MKDNSKKMLGDPKFCVDLYKLAEETLLEKIQADMLTPEQKKIKEYERFKEIEDKEKVVKAQKDQEALNTQTKTGKMSPLEWRDRNGAN